MLPKLPSKASTNLGAPHYVHDLGEAGLGTDDPLIIADFVKSGYRALEDLKKEGSIRAVGLGVNTIGICEDLLSKIDLDVILLAGRYTLLEPFQAPPLLETCRQKGTQLVIGGVFNSGIMATGPVEGAHYDYGPAPRSVLDRVGAIQEICDRHDVPLAAAAFRFPGLHEAVACTLVGTAKQTTLSRNLAQSKLPIPEAVWTDLAAAGLLDMGAS